MSDKPEPAAEATPGWPNAPVDRALMIADQRRSFVRGETGRDPGDILADEVRRLRALLAGGERDAIVTRLRNWVGGKWPADQSLDDDIAEAALALEALAARLAAAQEQTEALEKDAAKYREALVAHNDNARSFFQIANRIATELGTHALSTNFGAFAEVTHRMLTKYHQITNEARDALKGEPK